MVHLPFAAIPSLPAALLVSGIAEKALGLLRTGFWFCLILGIMVLVHEFGHFLVAKLCGVRVEVFSIGFGKRILGFRRGETDYRLSILPFGGYVKMTGEQPGEATTGAVDEFSAHPRWQRVLIALAGPVFNFILAFFLMLGLGLFHHEVPEGFKGPAVVDYVAAGSPAAKAGMKPGDVVTQFLDEQNPDWLDLTNRALIFKKEAVHLAFSHDGQQSQAILPPIGNDGLNEAEQSILGMIPRIQSRPLSVFEVQPNTPASRAGLQPKDQIISIDGQQLHSVPALLAYLRDSNGKPAVLNVLRDKKPVELHVTPEVGDVGSGHKQFRLGFKYDPPPVTVDHLSLPDAIRYSWTENKKLSMMIVDVIHGMFTRRVSVSSVSGPVGIFEQVGQASEQGRWTLVAIMASISLNLGIFNLLPFPILDGGMILFLIIESIMRRDLNQEWKERIYQGAFVILLLFAAFIIFNDFSKISYFHRQ